MMSSSFKNLSNNNALHLLHGKLPGTITQLGGRIVNQSLNGSDAIVPFLKYGIINRPANPFSCGLSLSPVDK